MAAAPARRRLPQGQRRNGPRRGTGQGGLTRFSDRTDRSGRPGAPNRRAESASGCWHTRSTPRSRVTGCGSRRCGSAALQLAGAAQRPSVWSVAKRSDHEEATAMTVGKAVPVRPVVPVGPAATQRSGTAAEEPAGVGLARGCQAVHRQELIASGTPEPQNPGPAGAQTTTLTKHLSHGASPGGSTSVAIETLPVTRPADPVSIPEDGPEPAEPRQEHGPLLLPLLPPAWPAADGRAIASGSAGPSGSLPHLNCRG